MEAKGKGYAYWAKNFNSKQYAKSILFLTENHLSIDDLPRAVEEACTKADALTAKLKKVEAQIASTSQLIDQVRVYLSAVSTYKKYKASGWSRAFFAEHESEIRQETLQPHSASVISSTRRTDTPARYISMSASSTLDSRRR